MSLLEELRNSRQKAQVAFQEFALSTGRFPECLFCFFEGKDNGYYVPRIKHYTNNYKPIICGGREDVLDVHRLIKGRSEYNSYKKAFFIDRDFNAPLSVQNPPIHETACYSIENFYISEPVFKEILINQFHLSEITHNAEFLNAVSLFNSLLSDFHDATRLFNAWYACLIDERNKLGKQTGVNLEEKFPKGFINISLEGVNVNYNFEKIKQSFPAATEISEEVLNAKVEQFNACDASKTFRGKYEMDFLLKFVHLLLKDSASTKVFLKTKINFAFGDASGINNLQAINIFSAYAETPESLIQYIKTVLK